MNYWEPNVCEYCLGMTMVFRQINANGAEVAVERCSVCYKRPKSSKMFLPKSLFGGDVSTFPVYRDNLKDADPCERCGSREGTEYHHWMPHHLSDDADSWPGANLCKKCHKEWHDIVTPEMTKRRKVTA
jgi:hypothetical protein